MISRRSLLLGAAAAKPKPREAAVVNAYFPTTHADVFLGRLLGGYRLNGKTYEPRVDVVSMYVDQFPINDMAREQAEEFGIKIYPSVEEALRLGGSKLAVDGVAIIGEHGNYPRTPRGSFMYPRWKHFNQVAQVFENDGKVVPVLNDKYFAYEWADAKRMYETVRRLKIPFQCGSTLPLTWRRPALEFQRGIELDELLAVSFSDLEEHGYHAVELLQCMAERRKGGEVGVTEIRCVEGPEALELPEVKNAATRELLEAALSRRVNPAPGTSEVPPQAILIRYRDGLKASILNLNAQARDYLFAAREKGHPQPHSSCFYIQLYNHNHWSFMVRNFEDLVLTRRPPNPIERTYLSTGITLFALESRLQNQRWLQTPELEIKY